MITTNSQVIRQRGGKFYCKLIYSGKIKGSTNIATIWGETKEDVKEKIKTFLEKQDKLTTNDTAAENKEPDSSR